MALTVAVIGGGMAGLAAAYHCQRHGAAVTVYESHAGFGMNAHALPCGNGMVDVPLRVMSPRAWSSVLGLAAEVGVGTFAVDTFVSCSWPAGETWFRSARMPLTGWPTVGSWRYLNGRSLGLALGLWRLRRTTARLRNANPQLTVGELIEQERFDPLFWRGLVLPLLTTICTCEEAHLQAWPAGQLLPLLDEILHGGGLVRIEGGTTALVRGLSHGLTHIGGSRVVRVAEQDGRVLVRNARGESACYDRVIIATQANQLDFLEGPTLAAERAVLGAIRFDTGTLLVHRDVRFMPRRRSDWSALNFRMDRALARPTFTVWVNAVEPTLAASAPVFQTWNPEQTAHPDQVLAEIPFQRAVVHAGTAAVHEALTQWHQTPGRRIFYCGSWAYPGVPLLESAVRAGFAAADALRNDAG